ncbi:hypothetical protein HRE53_03315 [Acaryochloris sp. 'Moss Beach']|uniref:hypothetical protein n=1 Tax=Acaryochloris sp. 'Moss Beach' TaxID=2740837 RepID=UPI001F4031E7|nr:hypothetical protein [Acaryochloris sp. 'Moss Beach']UJB70187.1 hypothetical protein HRE53_03315 [Acaryochloris sp. 'Moss Beach']
MSISIKGYIAGNGLSFLRGLSIRNEEEGLKMMDLLGNELGTLDASYLTGLREVCSLRLLSAQTKTC